MHDRLTISGLRAEMKMTQGEFAGVIGVSSKGHVSDIERSGRCSLRVALAIEGLSEGRIDAADLNEDVRLSRENVSHDASDTTEASARSPGNDSENSLKAQRKDEAA